MGRAEKGLEEGNHMEWKRGKSWRNGRAKVLVVNLPASSCITRLSVSMYVNKLVGFGKLTILNLQS